MKGERNFLSEEMKAQYVEELTLVVCVCERRDCVALFAVSDVVDIQRALYEGRLQRS
jgi:hypothetical protein